MNVDANTDRYGSERDADDFSTASVAEFLKVECAKRTRRNPSYSMRAFARDIGFSPSRLSEVMNKGQGISRSSVRSICRALAIGPRLTEYLCDLADVQFGRVEAARDLAAERIARGLAEPNVYEFKSQEFQVIANWYHLAILSLVETLDFRPDPAWIAARLRIDMRVAHDAAQRLERLGLLEMKDDGTWLVVRNHTMVHDQTAPEAMREFHAQILAKAAEAITSVPREQRFLQATIAAVPAQGMEELIEAMRHFQTKVSQINSKYADKSDVIVFSMQAFPLSRPIEEGSPS